MPEVISIGHDDDLDDDDYSPPRPSPRLNPIVIIAVGGALLLALVVAVVFFMTGDDSPQPTTTTGAAVSTTAVTPLDPSDSKAKAVQGALDAWAKFENTGDLAVVKETFDQNGPQVVGGQEPGSGFVNEVANIKARGQFTGTYSAKASNFASAGESNGRQLVVADVVWSQSGKADQQVRWVFELVGAGDGGQGWRVWTVRPATGGGAAAAPQDFCSAAKAAAAIPGNAALNGALDQAKSNDARLQVLRENTRLRLEAWRAMSAVAPAEVKPNVEIVVNGLEAQDKLVNSTKDLKKINEGLAKDTAITAIPSGVGPVVAAAQTQCGVTITY
ncbi:MAG: hypothetical protein ACOYNI_01265 [Acidimicrobiia bacterium]